MEAKIEAVEKEAAQALKDGKETLYATLQQRLAALEQQLATQLEEKLLQKRQGVWICCLIPLPSWCVAFNLDLISPDSHEDVFLVSPGYHNDLSPSFLAFPLLLPCHPPGSSGTHRVALDISR